MTAKNALLFVKIPFTIPTGDMVDFTVRISSARAAVPVTFLAITTRSCSAVSTALMISTALPSIPAGSI